MEWKRYFRPSILERGRDYYKRKRVHGLKYDNLIFSARVLGEKAYDVEIKERNGNIVYMKCNCPFAISGSYCKHMAAVMYEIEEKGSVLKEEKKEHK